MNTYLIKLFEKYDLSPKDRYDIDQIYSLLPLDKQRNMINNFDVLAYRLKQIEEDVYIHREILIGQALDKITDALMAIRQENSQKQTKGKIDLLKQKI